MKIVKNPKVTLVGAGPGDIELITVKGLKAIQNADVILYDALVNPEVLDFAPKAQHIYVGKRKGNHRYSQDEINKLIVDQAFTAGHVVRLKGGDPFIFGRGSEELQFIESFGIETEVVPGVSSATSVPMRQGISLTHRGTAESFWVITGTTSDRKLSNDVHLASKSTATVVILMGMTHLDQIVASFQREGKGSTPVAIIQNGYMKNEKVGIGRIDTIEEVVKMNGLSHPAIIVIGEVVGKSHKLQEVYSEVESYYLEENESK